MKDMGPGEEEIAKSRWCVAGYQETGLEELVLGTYSHGQIRRAVADAIHVFLRGLARRLRCAGAGQARSAERHADHEAGGVAGAP